MSKGKKTTTKENSTAVQTLDPTLSAALYGNLAHAQAIAATPFQPYSGQRVATFNPTQLAAQQSLLGVAASNPGGGLLSSGAAGAQAGSSYRPISVASAGYAPTAAQTASIDRGAVRDIGASPISADAINSYLNPYQQQVVDTSLADLDRQRRIQQLSNDALATRSHAFGGTGGAVLRSLTDETFARQGAQTAGQLRSQGYVTALAAAQADAGRRLQADQGNQQADFNFAHANAGFGQEAGLFNAGAVNQAAQLNSGQNLVAQQANQQAGLTGSDLNLRGAALLGQFAGQERANAIGDASLLGQVGDAQHANTQVQLDALYQEYLLARDEPYRQQELLNQALQLIHPTVNTVSSGETVSKTKSPLELGSLGGLLTGLGNVGVKVK